jgi:hypothetical protein
MGIEIVTKEDLEVFRIKLLGNIREILLDQQKAIPVKPEGYKTADVRKILGCSVNKLVSLRVSRNLRTKKIGGTIYYNVEDVKRLLEEGY